MCSFCLGARVAAGRIPRSVLIRYRWHPVGDSLGLASCQGPESGARLAHFIKRLPCPTTRTRTDADGGHGPPCPSEQGLFSEEMAGAGSLGSSLANVNIRQFWWHFMCLWSRQGTGRKSWQIQAGEPVKTRSPSRGDVSTKVSMSLGPKMRLRTRPEMSPWQLRVS